MEESIYRLVPQEYVEVKKPAMYRSKHDPRAPVTGSTFGTHGNTQLVGAGSMKKKGASTFGPPLGKTAPDPKSFTKMHAKAQRVPPAKDTQVTPFHYDYSAKERKTNVPLRDEKPVMGLRTAKNFITANAVETILQVPTLRGQTEPDYLRKADYGQTPSYLAQVKDEIHRENDMIDAYVREQMGYESTHQTQYEEMSEGERLELIDALKAKWGAVNQKYQKICHMVKLDTIGKVKRKEAMEAELRALEEDIERLERPGPVLVAP
uniref:Enkurin domain-containing protein n=1 Tax=Fibrocapsa japonica TaxID=94617 RepID=A0A7S2Y1M7_9STRA|mmetsp:Transcript_9590/g.14721  ORF Transcript_9590/g.14721 Transcript_9590/m.14721 type:complete len:264 (+) Transcript_9590:181-972(+)|eukprot:CAMPEP_0113943550 /NCGR_PEP_ID=MMETSP1339-20121228/26007_1 /TAXON_ID=94617 /ORGANISM="Fibrocapsa japonica" /LENGTH=263 /DNA_ID=CAMNT_0000948453 /DNA_START=129 /DNA_END=920 /DNA_ORIENTATION=- /assembly_acc=CAM_ASM_000762